VCGVVDHDDIVGTELLQQRTTAGIQDLGLTPVGDEVNFTSYTRPKSPLERASTSVLEDEEALSYLTPSSRR
jgi:hypothetical protein